MATPPTETNDAAPDFKPDEDFARQLDSADPLAGLRERFCLPTRRDGQPAIYLCSNSLGLMPAAAREAIGEELDAWAAMGVDGHFHARRPWYTYGENYRDAHARLVGARPREVVAMNGLTINLHLMMETFYRPTESRFKILMEDCAFPSDTYAIKTQLARHGLEPADALIIAKPRDGEHTLRDDDLVTLIEREGDAIALVLMGGVNYYTGQVFDMPRIGEVARRRGCVVGFDLAHAVGNIPLRLHDWEVDFAVWCTYKYLCAGPGSVAGCFVHERHADRIDLPRLGGWWGNDPDTRFRMHLQPDFIPRDGADGWQVSNPPVLSLAAVRASLELFDEVGMTALRNKSQRLTGYLQFLIDQSPGEALEVITPREPERRGCQLSMFVHDRARERFSTLQDQGIYCDFREPDVIRVAPVPLYNTFHEVWRFARILTGSISTVE